MRTPPGWHPDPGHTGVGPAPERWWDGERWTEHTRAGAAVTAPPGFPPPLPPPPRPKGPLIAGIIGGLAVVVALVVGGVLIVSDDGGGSGAQGEPSPTASQEDDAPDDEASDPPDGGPSGPGAEQLTPARGVRLPLLEGWTRAPGFHGASVGAKEYTCPGEKPERCVRAGAVVLNAPGPGDAEAVAGADIQANAAESYSREFYGGIVSHEEVRAEEVEVAGQEGYRVRWKIDNKVDPDAYVESVAFPHPDGSGRMLLLRIGFDIHADAPPPAHMEKLVEGVSQGEVSEDGDSEQVRHVR